MQMIVHRGACLLEFSLCKRNVRLKQVREMSILRTHKGLRCISRCLSQCDEIAAQQPLDGCCTSRGVSSGISLGVFGTR